jgi:hypothetical protein
MFYRSNLRRIIMNQKLISITSIALVVSILLSACDISITINPTSVPALADTPSPVNAPEPTATKVASLTDEPVHELYAGLTGDSEIPFLLVHQASGENLGLIQENHSSSPTGVVWTSSNAESVVIYTDEYGVPTGGVVGDYILKYSNYTNRTVDVTVIYPNGTRDVFRTEYDTELINKLSTIFTPSYSEVAFSIANPSRTQQQDLWGYIKEGLFAISMFGCINAAKTPSPTIQSYLIKVGAICAGALVQEVINERRLENLDVGPLEIANLGIDVAGCFGKDKLSCLNAVVDAADKIFFNPPSEPQPTKKKYP